MIRSMTGFGAAATDENGARYIAEVRAVNTAGVRSDWATSTVTVDTTASVRNRTFYQDSAPTADNTGGGR